MVVGPSFDSRETSHCHHATRRTAFTLVELLVVIAIIGILMSLTLPAIQASRESSRRLQCANQLKQIAIAWQNHHTAQRFFPTGGWGYNWIGDPDRGYGVKQPGGWVYNILPYMEQGILHDMGKGIADAEAKKTALTKMCEIQPEGLICPTRRPAEPTLIKTNYVPRNANFTPLAGKSDYASNVGDADEADCFTPGPSTLAAGDSKTYGWPATTKYNGVNFLRSQISTTVIRAGTSHIFMVGEKFLRPENYFGVSTEFVDWGDNEVVYSGDNRDFQRSTLTGPFNDILGPSDALSFGSAHTGAFNMSYCDGSVRSLTYEVDATEFRQRGIRNSDASFKDL